MNAFRSGQGSLADWMMERARRRFARSHPEWAEAMAREGEQFASESQRLRWAVGCVAASFTIADPDDPISYGLALSAGVLLMGAYEWRADENVVTWALLGSLSLALGLLSPRRFWLSGLSIGCVIAGVSVFETLSGVRPSYEAHGHSLLHDACWSLLSLPALGAAGAGRLLARRIVR